MTSLPVPFPVESAGTVKAPPGAEGFRSGAARLEIGTPEAESFPWGGMAERAAGNGPHPDDLRAGREMVSHTNAPVLFAMPASRYVRASKMEDRP